MRPLLENFALGRRRSAVSRCDAAGRPGLARVGSDAQGGGIGPGASVADTVQGKADRAYAWGVLSALGLAVAAVTAVFDLGSREQVVLTPFVNLVLTWNTGISYGLFPQESTFGQWALLAFKALVV